MFSPVVATMEQAPLAEHRQLNRRREVRRTETVVAPREHALGQGSGASLVYRTPARQYVSGLNCYAEDGPGSLRGKSAARTGANVAGQVIPVNGSRHAALVELSPPRGSAVSIAESGAIVRGVVGCPVIVTRTECVCRLASTMAKPERRVELAVGRHRRPVAAPV